MSREHRIEDLGCGGTSPRIDPFPPAPNRVGALENLSAKVHGLLDPVRFRRFSVACARRWNHWRRWYHWLSRSHTPYRAVFVIASPRSGSNLLIDYLSRLPAVGCLAEVLNWGGTIGPKKFQHPQQIVKHLRQSLHTLRTAQRACKIFLHEMEYYRLAIDDLERAFPDARYLVLYRANLAEQFVSMKSALRTGQWILLPGQQRKKVAVTVDPGELRHYCQQMWRTYTNITSTQAVTQRGAVISYEELVTNPARCLHDVVCPCLGVPYVEPNSSLCKQNAEPLTERVANYGELADILNSPLCQLRLHTNSADTGREKAA